MNSYTLRIVRITEITSKKYPQILGQAFFLSDFYDLRFLRTKEFDPPHNKTATLVQKVEIEVKWQVSCVWWSFCRLTEPPLEIASNSILKLLSYYWPRICSRHENSAFLQLRNFGLLTTAICHGNLPISFHAIYISKRYISQWFTFQHWQMKTLQVTLRGNQKRRIETTLSYFCDSYRISYVISPPASTWWELKCRNVPSISLSPTAVLARSFKYPSLFGTFHCWTQMNV